jgi:hypothetical protein
MSLIQERLVYKIRECRYEMDVDKQISMLNEINKHLPGKKRIRLPSLMTNDYVAKALDIIEELSST